MLKPLPLDIAPDLKLTIGRSSVKVTPQLGMRLAQSLLAVSARELVREQMDAAARRRVEPTRAGRR